MYESFYGLEAKPFSMLPDPEFLYLGKKHKMALTLLEYGLMNKAGFCVITGEIGAGKTTLLRRLLNIMEDNITVGMITNTHQSFGELLDWVLSAYGIHQPGLGKVEMHQRLVDFLLEQYANNKTTLLVVDEAQNMPATTLEELRMLSNINTEKDLVLQVILSGQPDLKDTLRKPKLVQFAQRISVDFHLDALNSIETCSYIQHRLVTAGATDDIFTPDACRLIHHYSGGVPRLINLLCDTALVYGFADQRKTVDVDLVEEMVSERMENSILPLVNIDKNKAIDNSKEPDDSEVPDNSDDGDFPWINPDGGTEGLKPEPEKKNSGKAASELEQTKDKAFANSQPAQHEIADEADTTETEVPVVIDVNSANTSDDIVETPAQAVNGSEHPSEKDTRLSKTADETKSNPVDQANVALNPVSVHEHEEPEKSRTSIWIVAVLLVSLAVLLSVSIVSLNKETELKDEVNNRLAEVERMKQDMGRMQREREAALEKARMEQQQRAEAEQAAVEAANKERAAMAAAELAAEEALQATKKAEDLAKKQRLEEQKLRDERKRIELDKQQAEREWQRVMLERKEAKLEQQRLELERAKAGELAQ